MGKSKQTVSQTTDSTNNQTLDPYQQDQWEQYNQRIAGQEWKPYGGEMVAGPNANQQAAWNQAGGIGALGQDQMAAAGQAAAAAAGYAPQMVRAGKVGGVQAAPFQGAAAGNVGAVANIQAQNLSGAGTASQTNGVYGNLRGNIRDVAAGQFGNLSPYMNEYNNQVVNNTLDDVERSRQMAVNQGGDAAASRGAFGGSRQGVADALTNEAYARESARTSADLRARGFDTAAALQQSDLDRRLQAGGMNQGADAALLGQTFGITNQQGMANQNANLQAAMSNQGTQLARGQTNASLATNASIANMQGRTQNSQFNANLGQNAQLANQDASLRAGMANQGAGLAANQQQLQAGGLLGQLGSQQQQMGMNGMNALGWAGGQEYGIDQARNQANYNQYLNQQGWQQQQNQNLLNGIAGQPGLVNQTGSVTNTETVEKDRFGQLLGAGAALAGGPVGGWIGGQIGGMFGGGNNAANFGGMGAGWTPFSGLGQGQQQALPFN
ncbi:MAG: hypothetical protein ACPHCN_07240, partial [Mycobacterium sp.]